MDPMAQTPAHAKPARRDLLWALIAILACGLLEVWASWLQIGAVSGFPKLGPMTTGWILPVTSEAYWVAALYAWLADPAGPRSRRFAMLSAAAVFLLSLAGQESDHLLAAAGRTVPPAGVVGFVTALPLIAVALIAVLIHLRQKDRDEAAEADERTAVQAEMDALRAGLEALTVKLGDVEAGRAEAEAKTAEAVAKVAVLTQKLARASGQKRTRKSSPKKPPASTPEPAASSPPEVQVPEDVDTQAAALEILAKEPEISGSELGRRLGKSERYGCMLKRELAGSAPGGN